MALPWKSTQTPGDLIWTGDGINADWSSDAFTALIQTLIRQVKLISHVGVWQWRERAECPPSESSTRWIYLRFANTFGIAKPFTQNESLYDRSGDERAAGIRRIRGIWRGNSRDLLTATFCFAWRLPANQDEVSHGQVNTKTEKNCWAGHA